MNRFKMNSLCAGVTFSAIFCATLVVPAQAQVSENKEVESAPVATTPAPASSAASAVPAPAVPAPAPAAESETPTAASKVDLGEEEGEETKATVNASATTPAAASTAQPAAPVGAAAPAGATVPEKTTSQKQPAAKAPPEPEIDYGAFPWTYHQQRVDIGVGVRLHWVTDSDYELFSDSDLLPLFNLRAGSTVWTNERWSLAVLGEWDYGASSGDARGVATQMHFHRFQLGGELRYHVTPRFAPFARLSLGAAYLSSRIGEEDAVAALYQSGFQFTSGLNLGAAFRVLGSPDGRKRAPRLHLFAEAGYALNSSANLDYEVDEDGPLRPEGVELGSLSMGGPQLTFGLLGSF